MNYHNEIEFGIYLYGWYNKDKWTAHKCIHTPAVGYYNSESDELIKWQINCLKKTKVNYVIFELVPLDDVSFSAVYSHLKKSILLLKEAGIGYTFLIDFWVFHKDEPAIEKYRKLIQVLKQDELLENIYKSKKHGQRLYLFCPEAVMMDDIKEITPNQIEVFASLWTPTWGKLDYDMWESDILEIFRPYWDQANDLKVELKEYLEPLNYFPFWQTTEDLICMNKIASVIPGYDDLLLNRNPQLAKIVGRDDGWTLVEQFRKAIQLGADTIIIYGWNEYFEATCIEPTLEYGDFYLNLTQKLIEKVRSGEGVDIVPGEIISQKYQPIYLTEQLKAGAERHDDKIPRWESDEYVANLAATSNFMISQDENSFHIKGISIINNGTKPWLIKSKDEPIHLGLRILDADLNVLSESRSYIPVDLRQGQEAIMDISADISGLRNGRVKVVVDMVYESRFWFDPDGYNSLNINLSLRHD